MIQPLLDREDLAKIFRTSPATISNQIYRGLEGVSIPISITIGNRRFWLPETVYEWLKKKESDHLSHLQSLNEKLLRSEKALANDLLYRPQNPNGIQLLIKNKET